MVVVLLRVESALTLGLDSVSDQDELEIETRRGPDLLPCSSVRVPLKPALTSVCSHILGSQTLFHAICRKLTLAMKVFFYKQHLVMKHRNTMNSHGAAWAKMTRATELNLCYVQS